MIQQIIEDFVPHIRDWQGLLAYYVLDAGEGAFATVIRSGEMPSIKLGGSIKVQRADLEEYLANHRRHEPQEEGVASTTPLG